MHALRTLKTSLVNRPDPERFRQRSASALMHPLTLGALGVLLVNDLVFKTMWPGAWVPGKLSDFGWMIFAPPVLAFILSFATFGRPLAQRTAFLTAYVGLPLLYVAFNTFQPVHDVILHMLGWFGGDGPRSPLDPTDSIVIPFAMAAAIWAWRRPPLEARSVRIRLALLAATASALASVASTYDFHRGVDQVGRTASGVLGANVWGGHYESVDGGLTWTKTADDFVPLESLQFMELGEGEPSGIFSDRRIQFTDTEVLSSGNAIYSFKYLQSGGNRWMQALDKRQIDNREIAVRPRDFFYDSQSGNLILAMGLQGVVVIASDGTTTQVAVGPYSHTDFSFWNKARTFFNSLAFWGATIYNTVASFLLAFSFASLALAVSAASKRSRWAKHCLIGGAAVSAFLAISLGVYPRVSEHPLEEQSGWFFIGYIALFISGLGIVPFLLAVAGLVLVRTGHGLLLAIVAATTGMLLLTLVGALVLFETGPLIANFVAVGLVGLAAFGLWSYRRRRLPTETLEEARDDG